MQILGTLTPKKKTIFNAQFATDATDSTGNFTTTNTGAVTFSGGRAVWTTGSPTQYLTTNEDLDWNHFKTLTVSTKVKFTTVEVGQAIWTICNAALDSYIRVRIAVGYFIVQVNGTDVTSNNAYSSGTDYVLTVKYYNTGVVRIYVNGILDGTGTVGTVPVLGAASRKLYIGYSPTFTFNSLVGDMDYLTIEEGGLHV